MPGGETNYGKGGLPLYVAKIQDLSQDLVTLIYRPQRLGM